MHPHAVILQQVFALATAGLRSASCSTSSGTGPRSYCLCGTHCSVEGLSKSVHPMQSVRVVIVPGNGAGSVHNANFYGWLHQKLNQPPAVVSVLRNMPGVQNVENECRHLKTASCCAASRKAPAGAIVAQETLICISMLSTRLHCA